MILTKLKYHWEVLIIISFGFGLRLVSSLHHSYSNDELSAISRLRFSNFSDLVEFGVMKGDMHPAGVHFFLKGWSFLFGTSELAMRLPFILFSTGSLIFIYTLGLKWFDKKTALLATGLMAFLCFPIIQGELARPYSLGLFAIIITVYFFNKVLFSTAPNWKHAVGLGAAIALSLYTHYFAFLAIAVIGFSGLLLLNKTNWKHYLLGCLFGVLLFLPHVGVTYYHLNVGGLQWLSPPGQNWLFEFLFFALNSSWYLILPLAILSLFGVLLMLKKKRFNLGLLLSVLWFVGIYLLGHVVSYCVTPVLKFPVMIFAFPFFLFIISFLITRVKYANFLTAAILLFAIGSSFVEKNLLDNKHYATFKELGEKLSAWKKEYEHQKITLFGNVNNENYLNFYSEDTLEFVKSNFEYGEELLFRELLKKSKTFYCGYVFASRNTPVQFFETALEIYPGIVDGYEGFNSAVYLLHRRESKIHPKIRLIRKFNARKIIGDWDFNEAAKVKDSYILDEFDPYGPSTLINVNEVAKDEYVKVNVTGVCLSNAEVTIGVNVMRNGELVKIKNEIFRTGFDIDPFINENTSGYFAFKVPPFCRASDQLKISIWNRGEAPFYLTSIGVLTKENIWNSYTP